MNDSLKQKENDAIERLKAFEPKDGDPYYKAQYDDGTPKTMWNLIPKKKIPPTRLVRWCCSELKESGGKGRLLITGVRWSESQNRRDNQGGITVIGKPKDTQRFLESQNVHFLLTNRGGWY